MSLIHNDNQLAHEILRAFATYFKSGTNKATWKYDITMFPKYAINMSEVMDILFETNLKKNLSDQKGSTLVKQNAGIGSTKIYVNSNTNFVQGDYIRLGSNAVVATANFPIAWDNTVTGKGTDGTGDYITIGTATANQIIKKDGTIYSYDKDGEDVAADVSGGSYPALVEEQNSTETTLNSGFETVNYSNDTNAIQLKFCKSTSDCDDLVGAAYDLNVWEVPHVALNYVTIKLETQI